MDYDFLLNNLTSFTKAEFIKNEPYLYAALRYSNKSANTKKARKRNAELSAALTALITLGVWVEASHELAQFYSEYNGADIKTTKQYLKTRADKELAEIFACGIHDYKNPNNARFVNDWIVQSYAIEKWINANADNRKKLDNLRFAIFIENTEAIKTIIQSAVTPFNEALKSFADELQICLTWQCQLNRCAADNGDAEAKYNLSKFYHYQPNKSLEYLTDAAEQGYAKAQCELGTYYCEQKNFTEAVKWFSLAGGQYAEASSALGKMYLNGNGVKKDLHKAIELFENATKCGDPEAYFYLACAYENGEGKEKDYGKAIEYYSVAAVLGNKQAYERLNTPDYLENE
ncbi:MAG: sel1 repeat family protein, partial [Clostridia bacterium]|nr:sel1 repeat family protein [Clostridia bacterium]